MSLTTRPPTPAPAHDLTDAEFAELDALLAATPEPFEPLDVVMLDGYLCGVIVQPVLLEPPTWLAHVFDFEGRPLPDDVDASWLARTTQLVLRRHGALNRALVEHGWFEPLILEPEDDDGADGDADGAETDEGAGDAVAGGDDAARDEGTGDDAEHGSSAGRQVDDDDADAEDDDDPGASLGPVSQALMPWVGGFQHAAATFPDLEELPDDAVMNSLARLYRHLPAETDEERELVATLEREHPLADLDEAIEDLVGAVADLFELTNVQRYKVDTVRRETPKVGRNEPCPCGSGKKYKQCHGAA